MVQGKKTGKEMVPEARRGKHGKLRSQHEKRKGEERGTRCGEAASQNTGHEKPGKRENGTVILPAK